MRPHLIAAAVGTGASVLVFIAGCLALGLGLRPITTTTPTTRPARVIVAPTTQQPDANTAICISSDGWPFRTSPDIARAHHLNCQQETHP